MSILSQIGSALGGSLIKEGFEVVKAYFPPSMSDAEKAQAELALMEFAHRKDLEVASELAAAEGEFNQRIKDLEGTAADLKAVPLLGPVMLFLRGAQRPAFGIFTLYADYQVFSQSWPLNEQQGAMLFAINILVLTFLFGERAVKNLMPFFQAFFLGKDGASKQGD